MHTCTRIHASPKTENDADKQSSSSVTFTECDADRFCVECVSKRNAHVGRTHGSVKKNDAVRRTEYNTSCTCDVQSADERTTRWPNMQRSGRLTRAPLKHTQVGSPQGSFVLVHNQMKEDHLSMTPLSLQPTSPSMCIAIQCRW
jgi:hypothetical protein